MSKKNDKWVGPFSFGQVCGASVAYLGGCASFAVYQGMRADLPLEKNIILGSLSLCLGFMLPVMAGIVGHETGRLSGALVGSIGEVGYRMADRIVPQTDRAKKIEKFHSTATTIGKAVGIGVALVAAYWGLHSFMTEAVRDAAGHGPKRSKTYGSTYIDPQTKAGHGAKTFVFPCAS